MLVSPDFTVLKNKLFILELKRLKITQIFTSHSVSPFINPLCYPVHGHSQGTRAGALLLSSRLYLVVPVSNTSIPFLCRDTVLGTVPHHVRLSCLHRPLGWCPFLRPSLFYMLLTVLRSLGQVFCRKFLPFGFSALFSWQHRGCGLWGRRPQR